MRPALAGRMFRLEPKGTASMMRQYELVERVQRYKPDVNEALLNKA
jgi:hypothetical protein